MKGKLPKLRKVFLLVFREVKMTKLKPGDLFVMPTDKTHDGEEVFRATGYPMRQNQRPQSYQQIAGKTVGKFKWEKEKRESKKKN